MKATVHYYGTNAPRQINHAAKSFAGEGSNWEGQKIITVRLTMAKRFTDGALFQRAQRSRRKWLAWSSEAGGQGK